MNKFVDFMLYTITIDLFFHCVTDRRKMSKWWIVGPFLWHRPNTSSFLIVAAKVHTLIIRNTYNTKAKIMKSKLKH